VAKAEKRTHQTTAEKLQWLAELRDEARHAGSEKAVAKHHDAGKLLARERAEKLCDPGSFVEIDRYVRHRESNFGMLDRRPYGDAVVACSSSRRTSRSSAAR
jgi:propionyl-CoA carboxylase beta chain